MTKEQKGADVAPGEDGGLGEAAAQAAAGDADRLQARLDEAVAALAEQKDKVLRAHAEVENVRRRAETEVANARKFGLERFAAEIISVKDSLELAQAVDLQHDNKDAVAKMFEGIELTDKLLANIFEKFQLVVVAPAKGDKFDPERHQAMSMMESSEVPANHVLNLVQKGYTLHERLLRPAMVIVAKQATANAADEAPE